MEEYSDNSRDNALDLQNHDINNSEHNNKQNDSTVVCNLDSNQIDNETIAKLRGDAIGDTMYSETFVVKTLLQLSDLKWSDKVEEDLCFLWDMTVEKDICEYLFKLSFPSIACSAICRYEENRLIEIIVGILANICTSDITPDITDDDIDVVLTALDTDDHLILVQVMRFVSAVAYHKTGKLTFITSDVISRINFILDNSLNKDLLIQTLGVVAKVTGDFKAADDVVEGAVVNSSINGLVSIIKMEKENRVSEVCQIVTGQQQSATTHFIEIITNICSYINVAENDRLLSEVSQYSNKLMAEISTLLQYFFEDDSVPPNEDCQFYIEAFTFIFPILKVGYHSDIFVDVFRVTCSSFKCDLLDLSNFVELLRYFISVGQLSELKSDLKKARCEQIQCLEFILHHSSTCEYNFKDKINMLINDYKNKPH